MSASVCRGSQCTYGGNMKIETIKKHQRGVEILFPEKGEPYYCKEENIKLSYCRYCQDLVLSLPPQVKTMTSPSFCIISVKVLI